MRPELLGSDRRIRCMRYPADLFPRHGGPRLSELGSLVLPPLYHEALTDELKGRIIERIRQCFPYSDGLRKRTQWQGKLEVVELPRAAQPSCPPPHDLRTSAPGMRRTSP